MINAPLRLLLIEDSSTDAGAFIDYMQRKLGLDTEIDVAVRFEAAKVMLLENERGHYDQIWLDPGLPDLPPNQLAKAISWLKLFGPVNLSTSLSVPGVTTQANQQGVGLINKEAFSSNEASTALRDAVAELREILSKRSGGNTTSKVDLAKADLRILHLEGRCDELNAGQKQILGRFEEMEEIRIKVALMVESVGQIPSIKDSLGRLEKLLDKEIKVETQKLEIRKVFLQYGLPAIVAAMVTLVGLFAPHLIPGMKPSPSPTSPSPSPKG